MRFPPRSRFLPAALLTLVALSAAACGQSPSAISPGAPAASGVAALAKGSTTKPTEPVPADVLASLTTFAKFEKRKVQAVTRATPDGRGAAELDVRLSNPETLLLRQLYRLNPRPIEPEKFPQGLLGRSSEHMSVLHHFKFPQAQRLEPTTLLQQIKPRYYVDQNGDPMAYETWFVGDNFQMAGKYDLKGRLLRVDIETWQ